MAPGISAADSPMPQAPVQLPDGEWTPATVLNTLPHPYKADTATPVPFFHLLERLKTTKREGWRRFNISHGETISDHMYRMSIITMLCPTALAAKLDLARCTQMALIHDMAESLVGDITPVDGVNKPEKSRRESETMDYISRGLLGKVEGGAAGERIKAVWQEYEDGVTMESKFVHDVDKIELLLQMVEYERVNGGQLDLGEFSWVAKRIAMPEVKAWADEVLAERAEFWKGVGKTPMGSEISDEKRKQQDQYYSNGHTNGGA